MSEVSGNNLVEAAEVDPEKILTVEDIMQAIADDTIVLRGWIKADVLKDFVKILGDDWLVYNNLTREQMFGLGTVCLSGGFERLNLEGVSGLDMAVSAIKEKAVQFREDYTRFARACDEVFSSVVCCGRRDNSHEGKQDVTE